MSAFQAVNTTTLTVPESSATRPGETTPTTPTPDKFFATQRQAAAAAAAAPLHQETRSDDLTAKTPTRDSFTGLAGQKPLPSTPFTAAHGADGSPNKNGVLSKSNSRRSAKSSSDGSQDVKMADDDDARDGGSDNESVTSDSNSRPSKKKKGQRFFCTDFPPCTLSFTRSEHLARHIRKHTGERPFQCHCSRRFSRLDNLRQHAQTVHVNEDIPGDSLAATGTRFQRQIRTDRVRPPNRSRASTLGSQGGHSRGHSRNLSTSSIASTASSVSQISTREDPRRRPPPLAMANDGAARARLSLDTFNPSLMGGPGPTVPNPSYAGNQSPSGLSTPTSATYSGTGSPRFPSGLQSPVSNPNRLSWDSRTPGRRLSVPSGTNPFQAPPNAQAPYISPLPSSTSSTFSGNSSMYASPTAPGFAEPRRDSNALDADWRRRTWHPGTYTGIGPRPATSGLSYYQTPDAPRPLFSNQPAASQTTRLPGIESFDHAPPPPPLPRRQPSPMQVDNPSRPPPLAGPFEPSVSRPEERRGHMSWDLSVQRGFSRLDITSTPPRETAYGWSEAPSGAQNHLSAARPTTAPGPGFYSQAHASAAPANTTQEQEQKPSEPPSTPRRNKRMGWYHGPLSLGQQPSSHGHSYSHSQQSSQSSFRTQRTSPEDSSSSDGVPTPSSSLGEYHPAIVHSNGYIESHPPGAAVEDHQKPGITQMTQPYAAERNSYGGSARPYSTSSQPPLPGAFAYRPEPERMNLPGPAGLGIMGSRQEAPNDMRRLEALVAVATGEQQGSRARQ